MSNKIISKKFIKKLSVLVLSSLFLTSFNVHAFTETLMNKDSAQDYKESNVSQIDFTVDNPSSITTNEIKTNDGKPIKSNIFKNNENNGNELFAVCYTIIDGVTCESLYFANTESIPKNELRNLVKDSEVKKRDTYKSMIEKKQDNADNAVKDNVIEKIVKAFDAVDTVYAAEDPILKSYNWSFYDNSSLQCTLTTNLFLTRESSNVDYYGKAISLWDVTSFSQLEKKNANRLNDQYTRLDVSSYSSSEKLIDFGPVGNSSGGSLSVGLDGLGVPSMQYNFSIAGFSLTDYSSLSGNYGRWHFWDGIGALNSMTTQPGIRVTNSVGALIVELSHTTNINSNQGTQPTHYTGVIQISVSDR